MRLGKAVLCGMLMGSSSLQVSAEVDLYTLSLEDLLHVKIFSATKQQESLSEIAAATYVITADEISRSPAKNIPELLRSVPGLNVAQTSASEWAVSIRGLTGVFATQLLVMVDGRSVYSPLFSGVRWESEMPSLESIERIEVIRGPGGALWGANATNGIINIISKPAVIHKNAKAVVQLGEEISESSLAVGGGNESVAWRASASFSKLDESAVDFEPSPLSAKTEGGAHDRYYRRHADLRLDGRLNPQDSWTLTSGVSRASIENQLSNARISAPYLVLDEGHQQSHSMYVLGRWQREASDGGNSIVQAYVNYFDRDGLDLSYDYHVIDLDLQRSFGVGTLQTLSIGANYRYQEIDTEPGNSIAMTPSEESFGLVSAFLQDELSIAGGATKLIVGVKYEDHEFTGSELMPSLRLLYQLGKNHRVWTAVSRAIREPSPFNLNRNIILVSQPGFSLEAVPGDEMKAENITSAEIGFRGTLGRKLLYDLSVFYTDYEDMFSGSGALDPEYESFFEPDVPRAVLANRPSNDDSYRSYGGELVLHYRPTEQSSWQASYSLVDISLDPLVLPQSPREQYGLNYKHRLNEAFGYTVAWRYVDSSGITGFEVENYDELDLRADCYISRGLTVSLIGKNLLHSEHAEWFFENRNRPDVLEIERTLYLRLQYEW